MRAPPVETFGYSIVGAGSAGCVLANRLSADRRVSVLLLEAGGSDAHPYIRANGHLYVRGQARDFDVWAQLGNRAWSFADVLPYFRRSEDRSSGADEFHGAGGPLHVSDIAERHPICEAFIAGAAELGIRRNPDYNGAEQDGIGQSHLVDRDTVTMRVS